MGGSIGTSEGHEGGGRGRTVKEPVDMSGEPMTQEEAMAMTAAEIVAEYRMKQLDN